MKIWKYDFKIWSGSFVYEHGHDKSWYKFFQHSTKNEHEKGDDCAIEKIFEREGNEHEKEEDYVIEKNIRKRELLREREKIPKRESFLWLAR